MDEILRVENLVKIFKTKVKHETFSSNLRCFFRPEYQYLKSVDNISFIAKTGESIAFVGPNGAGKSTTIKMLTGILYPTSGEINVCGLNPTKNRKKLAYKIGTMFGNKEQLWINLTPYDNFKFFGAIYGMNRCELKNIINNFADILNLRTFLHTPVKNLSLGQRIRCEIVTSLIHHPEILFLDEPTIGVDTVIKENIRYIIKKMNQTYGTTIFLTSHDLNDIERLCKRIIIISNGKLIIDDQINNLKHKYFCKKVITIKSKNSNISSEPLKKIDDIKILKSEDKHSLKFEINMNKRTLDDVISLIGKKQILDITLQDISLENIIQEIYKKYMFK